ncbi:MAG TPA: Sir2 family NAD-dependent protein deacetylase [Thermoanaerobaculia bacterium]|nr:Sir2 family NAD-dependent protein deacetylase [Thermoanaerobaculia bacterium]
MTALTWPLFGIAARVRATHATCSCITAPLGELSREEPPVCSCGGKLRPNVVWFGENLDPDVLDRAAEEASSCDLFLSVGTSAVVYPAAGLIEMAHRSGACLIEVNPEPTPFSGMADLRIEAPAGEALPKLTEEIRRCRKSP